MRAREFQFYRAGQNASLRSRLVSSRWLIDESAPGPPFFVAESYAHPVGHPADHFAVIIPEGVPKAAVRRLLGRAAPCLTVVIPQPNVVFIAETVHARFGQFLLEVEETTHAPAMYAIPFV